MNLKSLDSELKPVLEEESILQLKRNTIYTELQHNITKIKENIKLFSDWLMQSSLSNIEAIKTKASLISKIKFGIDSMKIQEKNVLKELNTEEKTLYQELLDTSKKYNNYKENYLIKSNLETSKNKCTSILSNRFINLPVELAEYEKFITSFGHTGGWEEFDHQVFLKYRNKFQKSPSFLKKISKHITGKSYKDIEKHEQWYNKYIEMKQKKKLIILNWKTEKEKEKKQRFIFEKEKKLAEMRAKNNLNSKTKAKKLEYLAAWKLKKEEEEKSKEKNKELLSIQKNKLKEKKKKEQERIHEKIKEYRQYKQIIKESVHIQHINKFKDISTNYNIQYFQDKDKEREKMLKERMQIKQMEKKKHFRLEQIKRKVEMIFFLYI